MKDPVDHILRPSLPWRTDGAITECGLNAAKVKTLTRPEYFDRLGNYGCQRTAILTCMTCSDTARRWKTWEEDPRQAMEREITWERGIGYRARTDHGERLREDLVAIAQLIADHRAEFDETLERNIQRREWLEKKAAHGAKKPPTKPRTI
jgi:hypothetical protein